MGHETSKVLEMPDYWVAAPQLTAQTCAELQATIHNIVSGDNPNDPMSSPFTHFYDVFFSALESRNDEERLLHTLLPDLTSRSRFLVKLLNSCEKTTSEKVSRKRKSSTKIYLKEFVKESQDLTISHYSDIGAALLASLKQCDRSFSSDAYDAWVHSYSHLLRRLVPLMYDKSLNLQMKVAQEHDKEYKTDTVVPHRRRAKTLPTSALSLQKRFDDEIPPTVIVRTKTGKNVEIPIFEEIFEEDANTAFSVGDPRDFRSPHEKYKPDRPASYSSSNSSSSHSQNLTVFESLKPSNSPERKKHHLRSLPRALMSQIQQQLRSKRKQPVRQKSHPLMLTRHSRDEIAFEQPDQKEISRPKKAPQNLLASSSSASAIRSSSQSLKKRLSIRRKKSLPNDDMPPKHSRSKSMSPRIFRRKSRDRKNPPRSPRLQVKSKPRKRSFDKRKRSPSREAQY